MAYQPRKSEPVPLTYFFYDYESTGIDKLRDRPTQFGGIRTDMDLNIIEEPVMFFAKPSEDVLVSPFASLLTKILPQDALAQGYSEHEFAEKVNEQLGRPGTCGVGYNSMAYDDELTRNMNYRNFIPPYAREYENGNSRWDIIHLARMCHALRSEGIVWPKDENGRTVFKLEALVKANHITQTRAHDALSDVEATIGLARLIKQVQPKLFEYYFGLRKKQEVSKLINTDSHTPLLHVASHYPKERAHLSFIAPLFAHPTQANSVYILDLMVDPTPLAGLSEDELFARFSRKWGDKGEEDEVRIGISSIAINKAPPICVPGGLAPERAEELAIDMGTVRSNLEWLRNNPRVVDKLRQVMVRVDATRDQTLPDAEVALYVGGFPSPNDSKAIPAVRRAAADPQRLAQPFAFDDDRYQTLLFRFKARNFPETLTAAETQAWDEFVRTRLTTKTELTTLTIEGYFEALQALRDDPVHGQHTAFLDKLQEWGEGMQAKWAPVRSIGASLPKP